MNTRLCYMYRDANNYKTMGAEIIYEGYPSDEMIKRWLAALEEGLYFKAELLGVPAMFPASHHVGNDVDHDWHEFLNFEETSEPTTLNTQNQIEDLILAAERAKERDWEPGGKSHDHEVTCLRSCCGSLDGVHVPDWSTATVADTNSHTDATVDVSCKNCGISGSNRITEVIWS